MLKTLILAAAVGTAPLAGPPNHGVVSFDATYSKLQQTATKPAGSVRLMLRRTGGSSGAVSIFYTTVDASAHFGVDYNPQNGRVGWADGDSAPKYITITAPTKPCHGANTFTVQMNVKDGWGGVGFGQYTTTVVVWCTNFNSDF